ncbi:MAG: acylneuraminate cytidylyltransferase family protein [Proteobacteria bacterium]|nr:acylneuraminate cytidylyltransferase family protein [Pseudomonadota bacterium]MBU1389478.1 acylneuraminate cytidylyltransferase family protein [Pseudomonadota bacterium]MBU1541298.1 acylneuraminate cytidylyltransferase family protein [Pseudomonadota bacterium]
MKILALIPARGGSKRIPGKNIRYLGDKPLINWTIDSVKNLPNIANVLVSTDNEEISAIAKKAGACVPWTRPKELATDTSKAIDVVIYEINKYEEAFEKVDGVLFLQPTSPFRKKETLKKGLSLYKKNNFQPVIGVSPAKTHPLWCFTVSDNSMKPFIDSKTGLSTRSQDLPSVYSVNGSFYLNHPEDLRSNRTFFSSKTIPLIMPSQTESIDIDTEWDWWIAEQIIKDSKL